MAKPFIQMAAEAMADVPGIDPELAHRRLSENPRGLLIDVLDLHDIKAFGLPNGAVPISAGMLPIRADQSWPEEYRYLSDQRLVDRHREIMTICATGLLSACRAKTLKEMGLTRCHTSKAERWAGSRRGCRLKTSHPVTRNETVHRPWCRGVGRIIPRPQLLSPKLAKERHTSPTPFAHVAW
jgi:rhodanese-related sulfurtransferase